MVLPGVADPCAPWSGHKKPVIAEKAWQAVHVLDRYHIMASMDRAIDHVRAYLLRTEPSTFVPLPYSRQRNGIGWAGPGESHNRGLGNLCPWSGFPNARSAKKAAPLGRSDYPHILRRTRFFFEFGIQKTAPEPLDEVGSGFHERRYLHP